MSCLRCDGGELLPSCRGCCTERLTARRAAPAPVLAEPWRRGWPAHLNAHGWLVAYRLRLAAFLHQVAHAEAAVLVLCLRLKLFMGAFRFWQRAFPPPRYHARTCMPRALCFHNF